MPPEPDSKRALALVMKLMAIPGKTGQEGRIVRFVTQQLVRAGAEGGRISTDRAFERSPIGGQSGNLKLRLPGTIRGPRRMLMAHLDTVPLCVGCKPVRRGGLVRSANPSTALGADNRSGVAVVLTAALEILRRKLPHPPVTFFFPVQEEIGLVGVRNASLGPLGRPALAFNFDSGDTNGLILGATGAYRMTIEVAGIASHAGVHPRDGVSAITIAAMAIASLEADGWHGLITKGKKKGTSNVGIINGGDATNVVTPHVTVRAEARSHDPQFRKRIVNEISRRFQQAARNLKNNAGHHGSVEIDSALDYESFELRPAHPCVRAAAAAVRTIGGVPHPVIVDGGLDANWITARGIPTVTLGAGQHHAHTVNEILNVEEFQQGCRLALRLATGTEGDDGPAFG